jgi:hypothetical protein
MRYYPEIFDLKIALTEFINRLGEISLTESALPLSSNERRRIRRKMAKTPFAGNLFDFICWVSTQLVAKEITRHSQPFMDAMPVLRHLAETYDVRNTLRLFKSNPDYLLDAIGVVNCQSRKKLTSGINSLWDGIVLEEKKELEEKRAAATKIHTILTRQIPKELRDALIAFIENNGFKVKRIEGILLQGQFFEC